MNEAALLAEAPPCDDALWNSRAPACHPQGALGSDAKDGLCEWERRHVRLTF